MLPFINLLELSSFPIFQQLQLEEALLRAHHENWCIINYGTTPAIVMGISGQVEKQVNSSLLMHSPLPVIRRFSGGGTVIVDQHTLFVTFIFNAISLPTLCCPQKIMQWTSAFYAPLFKGLDFELRENDYVLGNRKFGGNAQYLCKGRWLHHSSLLWDFSVEKMAYLKMPTKIPLYRDKREHANFLCKLSSVIKHPQELIESIKKELQQHFPIQLASLSTALEIIKKPHRQATQLLSNPFFL